MSPKTQQRLRENRHSSNSQFENPDIVPYAELATVRNNFFHNSHSAEDLCNPSPYATSTPNAFLANNLHPAVDDASTPLNCREWEKREIEELRRKEAIPIYAKVERRSSRKSRDASIDDSKENLIENSLFANKNLVQSQRSSSSFSHSTPPPLPERQYGLEDFNNFQLPASSQNDTIRSEQSQDDEGYSTIQKDHEGAEFNHIGDRLYEEVSLPTVRNYEVSSPDRNRNNSSSGPDPYTMSFNSKLEFFNKKNYSFLPENDHNMTEDVWKKRDVKPAVSRTSYPNYLRQPSYGPRAPLAQEEVKHY